MQNNSCPICGSQITHYNFESEGGQIYECSICSFLFKNQQIGKSEVVRTYTIKNKEIALRHLNILSNYYGKKEGRVLLMGENGKLLEVLKGAGFEVSNSPEGKFDICILYQVLENKSNPNEFLKKIHEYLTLGGVLFVITSPLSNNWRQFKNHKLNFFSSETLQNLLNKTAFREVYISEDKKNVLSRALVQNKIPKLSIIVPVFNEVKTFPELIGRLLDKKLPEVEKEIIIVESNSKDGTREEVLKYKGEPGVTIVLEDKPNGKGAAVRNGLTGATGDFILIQDGDLEYDINDYDQLLVPLINYQKAFVLGSRHEKGFKMRHFETAPLTSFIMNVGQKFFVTLLNIFCGQRLKDPFTMYKVFRRDCLYNLTFRANRFDFDFELVIKLLRKGYVPLEIPINYESRSFSEGKKVSVFRDPLTWIVALFRFRLEKLYNKKYDE